MSRRLIQYLPFNQKTYRDMLGPLEEALYNNTLEATIKRLMIKHPIEDWDCLYYLVCKLYPKHKDMLDKYMALK
jgi:hypothetical protein